MGAAAEVLFWLALATLAYAYLGFPLLAMIAGRVRSRPVRQEPVTPAMTLIIAAYNEEAVIAERLENALGADYPAEALEIVVASDGSSDATESIVARYAPRGVRLLSLPRRGKIAALREAACAAGGEILVFSDANTLLHPGALRALARNFADPEVGGVAGHTYYRLEEASESSGRGERLYWRYDTWLKEMESRAGSVISAHGGLYALRRDLFQAPADLAVTDDFAISTAVVEQGRRLVFERDALASEFVVAEARREFGRRVRLMTRGWRAVALRWRLLNPFRYGFYALALFTHKVLRRLLPLVLALLLACSLLLSPAGDLYFIAAAGQTVFYGLAGAGALARRTRLGQVKGLYVPFYFCMANAAALVALLNFVRGERIELWRPQRQTGRA